MRTIENPATISSNMPVLSKKKFFIDEKHMKPIFQSLIAIYSDQKMATLREYSANGRDSHIRAGQTRPIEVILPSHLNRNVVFRDYGVGMNAEEMDYYYAGVGASSKRESDDEIGNFGLGCKSALAMTPVFTVYAIKDGIKLHCTISKDSEGMPELAIITAKETEEPNGLEVVIPVSSIDGWESRAKTIFKTWPVGSVLVNGVAPVNIADEGYETVGELGWIGAKGNYRTMTAVMGGINYKVDLDYDTRRKILGRYDNMMSRADIVVHVPMGKLELVPARDALSMSPVTETNLAKYTQELIAAFMEQTATKVSSAENRIDALRALETYGFGLDRSTAKWNDELIPQTLTFANGKRYSYRGGRRSAYNESRVSLPVSATVKSNKTLIVDMADYVFGRDSILRHLPSYANAVTINLSEVYIGEPDKDNEWLKAMIEAGVYLLVPASELAEKAKEYNKANRAARVSSGTASPREAITYPVITFGENFQWERDSMTIQELREHIAGTEGKVYSILENDPQYYKTETAFSSASNVFFNHLARYGAKANDSLILVSKTRKIESLVNRIGGELLPNIMPVAYQALDDAIKTPVNDFSEKIVGQLSRTTHYTKRGFETLVPHVGLIKDPEIVKVLNLYSGERTGANLKAPVDTLFGYTTDLSANVNQRNAATNDELSEFINHHPIFAFYCAQGGTHVEEHAKAVVEALNASYEVKGSFKKK